MRLNNKGFTIVETMACFVLVSMIAFALLELLMTYKNKSLIEMDKSKFVTLRENVTKRIQTDVYTRGLSSITRTTGGDALTFYFKDNTTANFTVHNIAVGNDNNLVRDKYIEYAGIKYKIPSGIPDSLPSGNCNGVAKNCAKNFQSVNINTGSLLVEDNIIENGVTRLIYTINVNIIVDDLDEDYGIHMTFSVGGGGAAQRIEGANILADSSFEGESLTFNNIVTQNNNDYPKYVNNPFDSNAMNAYHGSKALFYSCRDKSGGGSQDCYFYLDTHIPVIAGRTYTVSFWYASATNGSMSSSTYWKYSNGTHFGSFSIVNTNKAWTRVSTTVTIPTGVTYIVPRFGMWASAYSWMAVDAIKVEEGNTATDYSL